MKKEELSREDFSRIVDKLLELDLEERPDYIACDCCSSVYYQEPMWIMRTDGLINPHPFNYGPKRNIVLCDDCLNKHYMINEEVYK